jgi:hypothetical protein
MTRQAIGVGILGSDRVVVITGSDDFLDDVLEDYRHGKGHVIVATPFFVTRDRVTYMVDDR